MKKLLLWAITASLLVAAVVTFVGLLQTPTYKASTVLLVGQREQSYGKIHPIPNAPTPTPGRLQALAQTTYIALDTRPVAEEVIRRLGLEMSPKELLDNFTVEQVASTKFVGLTYEDADPKEAARIADTFAEVASERISEASAVANDITATVWEKAEIPDAPASPKPLRNGLIALVVGLTISSAALFAVRRGWLPLGGMGAGMFGS
jgi:capsular polysaccharide biosynthesis protein